MAKPKALQGKKLERAKALLAKGLPSATIAARLKISRGPVDDLRRRRKAYAR